MQPTIQSTLRATTLLILLLAALMIGSAHAQDFTIENFHADIAVGEDGTVDVTERIVVVFDEAKHGIYREIPYRYVNDLGDKISMPVTVHSVAKEDGSEWTKRVKKRGDVVNIRIGDAHRFVRGRQVYVIHYRVENAIRFFADYDELYWNVTGNYWRAAIDRATATIRLNSDKTSSKLEGNCYTGRYGSAESDCEYESKANQISFRSTRRLRAGEGLTAAMGWDEGIVQPPSEWQKFAWATNLRENWVFVVPVVIFLFMLIHWYRRGRDPRVREAVTVMYEPPAVDGKPLTPAQTGVLIDASLDHRDLTGSLIGMAAKGYLKLQEMGEGKSMVPGHQDMTLIKLKETDEQLSRFERTLMEYLLPGDRKEAKLSDMKNKFYTKLPNLQKIMFEELVAKKFFAISPMRVTGKYVVIGIGVVLISTFLFFLLTPFATWKCAVAGILSGAAVLVFAGAMPARTRRGALTRIHILGFQEFMNRADKDRLERMGEQVFYKYLPYAIALDVVDHWVKAFEGILTAPPSWYVPVTGATAFTAHQFTRAMTTTASHLGSTMFSAPRGSGSSGGSGGGGGFSGGGGGGGGGGSW